MVWGQEETWGRAGEFVFLELFSQGLAALFERSTDFSEKVQRSPRRKKRRNREMSRRRAFLPSLPLGGLEMGIL